MQARRLSVVGPGAGEAVVHRIRPGLPVDRVGEVTADPQALLADGTSALETQGDLHASREWFDLAYQAADQAGDHEARALAALGLGGLWVHEHRAAAGSAMLQSRLRHALSFVDPRSPTGMRLRMRLGAESDYRAGEHATVMGLLDEALTFADPLVRAEARSMAHHCLLGPDHGTVRLRLATEMVEDSHATARRGDLLMGMLWRTVDMFLSADPHAARRLRDLRSYLADGDHLAVSFVADAIDVMLAIRAGRLEQAEIMAAQCAERGATAGDVDATGWYGAQMVTIRWYQGRIAELLPMLIDLVHSPTLSEVDNSFFAGLAVAAAAAGDRRTAAGALATLRGRDLGELPRSSSWLVTLTGLVEAAYLLGDADTAARAYGLLKPYAHLPAMASLGVACFGSVEHALGVACLTTGDLDVAVTHLRAAVQQNMALTHWPAVIASRARYAEALLSRGRSQDAATAQSELAAARAEADSLGVHLPDCSAAKRGEVVLSCARQGQKWKLSFGSRQTLVGHSVGMLHLAVLIANPGKEVSAVDLVTGLVGLRRAVDGGGMSEQPVLDRAAAQQYRDRLSGLQALIDDLEANGHRDRAVHARAERDWLVAELAGAAGLGGRTRRFQDGGERARISVGKAIRRALVKICEADEIIGEHLNSSVHTGTHCSYRPS